MADIFISYARADQAFVERLAGALEAAGYSVWWDREISAGAEFAQKIEGELGAARVVVAVWSEAANKSNWVKDEAAFARDRGTLAPIRLGGVEPPLGFRQLNAPNFAGWDGDAQAPAFAALTKFVAEIVGRAPVEARRRPLWRRLAKRALKPQPLAATAAVAALIVAVATLALTKFEAGPGGGPLPDNALAVLPFVNAGGDLRDDYLSEGMADELRDQLGRVEGLKVSARASSVVFRDEKRNARDIAARLGVARLIEGSLLKQGSRVRVSVQIIDGRTGFQAWSQSYDRKAGDLLAVQQEIAAAIVAAVAAKGEAPPPATIDLTAYDKMLLARHYEQEVRDAHVVDEKKLDRAIGLYRAAAAADPASALAHSRLAGALLYAGDADAAEPEIYHALNLDPNLSEVQYTLGTFYFSRALPGVTAAFERAVMLNPNNADALAGYAHQLWFGAHIAVSKTEEFFRRARDIDPMSLRRHAELGYFYAIAGQTEKALAVVREIGERFAHPRGYSAIAQILEQTGDFDVAIAAAKKALTLSPQDEDIKAQLAELYAVIGDFETAAQYEPEPGLGQRFWRRDYKALIDLAEELAIERPEEAQVWYLLGFAYSAAGDHENAVRVLKLAGLPEKAKSESRVGNDVAAMATLAGALDASKATEEAHAAAEWVAGETQRYIDGATDGSAWSQTLLSCSFAVLGRDEEAMAAFARVNDGPGLPRMPWLKDYACFKRFAADRRYVSVVAAAERRQAEMRLRVAALDDASP